MLFLIFEESEETLYDKKYQERRQKAKIDKEVDIENKVLEME